MIRKLKTFVLRHREPIAYLFFGGLTTLVNILAYWILARVGLSTFWANGFALALSILFAYFTNRRWVFASRAHGRAALSEFARFIACRLGTGVLDQVIMVVGVDLIGPALVPPASLHLWGLLIKVLSNILVILLNYLLSKLLIFADSVSHQ